jgi:DNA invertase Pin-like site-specific DNA recombinase
MPNDVSPLIAATIALENETGPDSGNAHDRHAKGRATRICSEKLATRAKLMNEQADQIRELYEAGHTVRELATRFDVPNACVSSIINGKSYATPSMRIEKHP